MVVSATVRALAFYGYCVVAAALAASVAAAAPAVVALTLPSGKVLQVEVMAKDADREMGLMFRPGLAEDRGMLFVFDNLAFHAIWMKNCRFPIDILWLDQQRNVVHAAESVPPCRTDPCPVYEPLRRAAYVIELNAGQARREKATLGTTIRFEIPR